MTSEALSANGGGQISKLRRTLTLPLSKVKSRGGSFNTSQRHTEDVKHDTKSDEDLPGRKQSQRGIDISQSMRISSGRKNDIRVSRINPHRTKEHFEGANDSSLLSGKVVVPIKDDSSSIAADQVKKEKKKRPRYRRWPTQTLAKVLDGNLLKRLGSGRRNEHAATVLRNVTVDRSPGDVLGIYIKEVKRGSSTSSQSHSRVLISRLAPGSIAEKQGILKRGDEILYVNNRDVRGLPLKEVAASMDYHSQLLLSVCSKHINANNNNDKVTLDTSQSDFQPTSQNATAPQDDCAFSPPTITISSEFSQVPNASSSSASVGITREEAIPSVYDNNFPSSLVATVPSPEDEQPPVMTRKHQLEMEYNEALSILLNAINSFETPNDASRVTHGIFQPSDNRFFPASYWNPLHEMISSGSSDKSPSVAPYTWNENDNHSATSDSTTTSMSTTPFFPNVTELPISDDPEYDEVAVSEFDIEEEVQVDGYARLYSPYRRSHSVSSSTSGSIQSYDAGNFLASPSTKATTLHASFPHGSQKGLDSTREINSTSDLDVPDSAHPFHSEQTQDDVPKTPSSSVTVAQCRGWLDRGNKISPELKLRLEGGPSRTDGTREASNPAARSASTTQPATYDSGRTSSESSSATSAPSPKIVPLPHPLHVMTPADSDKSPMEKSPKILFKNPTPPEGNSAYHEHSSRRSPQTDNQASKTFWSKVASPPSLRKSKIGRRITKFSKRKGGSVDWDSTDSSFDGSKTNSSGIIDRYNLEPGEVQRHRLSCQFLPHNRPHDPSIKPLNFSDFKKYKPPLPNAESGKYSQIPIEGSLVITLYGARYIKKTVSEVYCICQVDDDVKHRIRTRMQQCRGSVAWNECYEAKLEEAYDLHITLYTWESEGKHKVLAKSTLPVSDLLCVPQGVPVKLAVKLDPRGTLYIKLSIEDPSTLEGPKVFGADIQSILDREQSGLHIPLIVRDCIREVETRGMQVVGIYRLCGSAIAKKELRKKYENDSTSVDLSQENYPDVNVITGILKDFLRELPQPLFPPDLLEAVTVAMEDCSASPRATSVSSPFDPTPHIEFPDNLEKDEDLFTGRQSVILNLIEVEKKATLPPAEKATLYALLNHLKKVSASQGQNKMTCQNLAVCFGPVLLGSINMAPSKGMDLDAAIGFKQHIQVLNFMVSNWPSKPVPLDSPEDVLISSERNFENISDDGSRRASKRISRVSLTRRISYVFASHNGSSSSSLSGCINCDGEARNGGMTKPILSNSRKSGSLTNILESNLDVSEGAFGDDGFFENQVEQDIFNQEDSADDWDFQEVPFQTESLISSRKSSI